MPFGIDTAVIVLAARSETLAWTVPCLAAAGSLAGGVATFWMGHKIGEAGLERYVSATRIERARRRIERRGAFALALLSLFPPPFPFTPFILAAGALGLRPSIFFATFAGSRMLRFGLEAALAVRYGRTIVTWIESDIMQRVLLAMVGLALLLTTLSIVRLVRSSHGSGKRLHS
jgi:membrane protein YqaA with SNARE-associated domain